jgi:hypothetical protein
VQLTTESHLSLLGLQNSIRQKKKGTLAVHEMTFPLGLFGIAGMKIVIDHLTNDVEQQVVGKMRSKWQVSG